MVENTPLSWNELIIYSISDNYLNHFSFWKMVHFRSSKCSFILKKTFLYFTSAGNYYCNRVSNTIGRLYGEFIEVFRNTGNAREVLRCQFTRSINWRTSLQDIGLGNSKTFCTTEFIQIFTSKQLDSLSEQSVGKLFRMDLMKGTQIN